IEPVISGDENMMVFARGKAKENSDLYYAEWNGRDWSEPRPLVNVNSPHDELGPELSSDGRLLYFYSDRPGGAGEYDIWVSVWSGDVWTAPDVLGTNVNSAYNEYDPALTPGDDRLFFSSNRPKDDEKDPRKEKAWKATLRELVYQNDYDILYADQTVEVTNGVPSFQSAVRVEALNTVYDEGQVDFTKRGDFLYFSSNRDGGKGGFDIYRSRLIHGGMETPRLVGRPISSEADDMDPALWLEGHSLVFSSNRDAETEEFTLFQSTSREVVSRFETGPLALVWEWLKSNWWLLLLLLLCLAALYFLLRWYVASKHKMSLTTKCLVGSVLLHLLLFFLLSIWFLTAVIIEKTKGPMKVEVNEAALAREKMSTDLREEVTELKQAQSDIPMPKKIERVSMPNFSAPEEVVDIPIEPLTPPEFVIDYQPPAESVPEPDVEPSTEVKVELPRLDLAMMTSEVELPVKEKVDSPEPEVAIEKGIQVEPVEKDVTPNETPKERTPTPEVAEVTPAPNVEVDTTFVPLPVDTEELPEITWTDPLVEMELKPEDAPLEIPEVEQVDTPDKPIEIANVVKVEQIERPVEELIKAIDTVIEPQVIQPEFSEVVELEPTIQPSPVTAETLPEIELAEMLPQLELQPEVEVLDQPTVERVETEERPIERTSQVEVEQVQPKIEELVQAVDVVTEPVTINPEVEPVIDVQATGQPSPVSADRIPDIDLADILPQLELEPEVEPLDQPERQAVETVEKTIELTNLVEVVQVQNAVEELLQAVETVTEPTVVKPEIKPVVDVQQQVQPSPISADRIPEIQMAEVLPQLELQPEVDPLDLPDVQPVDVKEAVVAIEN
ncbi:MAG: hypothetical protein AAF492_08350, partial [Verrucomicrobiota bacterium]